MENLKHTKGEWKLQRDNSISVNESVICQIGSANNNDIEKAANAKLIAAAPDMLKALESMIDYYIRQKELTDIELEDLQNNAINALKKAKEHGN